MISKNYSYILLFVIASLTLVAFQNCGEVNIAEKAEYQSLSTGGIAFDVCTRKSDTVKNTIKFLVVIDRSRSNQVTPPPDVNSPEGVGTDPDGKKRFEALMKFVQNYTSTADTYWAQVSFASSTQTVMNFTNNKANFINSLSYQYSQSPALDGLPPVGAATNYTSALDAAKGLIQADLVSIQNAIDTGAIAPMTVNYMVLFVSDGAPLINVSSVPTLQCQANDPLSPCVQKVKEMVKLKEMYPAIVDSIVFNGAYYYNLATQKDQTAIDLLSLMAATGYGEFYEFGGGANIDYSRFAIPTRTQRFRLVDLFVDNNNAVWWDGQYLLDSDGDGVPDIIEDKIGSDIYNADTDNDGVTDGIQYRLTPGQSCRLAGCVKLNKSPDICNGLTKATANPIAFVDSDQDGLNDCEEKLLGSNPLNFDSNDDNIPDGLAFKNGLNYLKGTGSGELFLDPDLDGINNYSEIKSMGPVRTDNRLVPAFKGLKYSVQKVSEDSSQACYHYDLSDVPTIGDGNKLVIYEVESTMDISTKKYLKRAETKIQGGGAMVRNSDFK